MKTSQSCFIMIGMLSFYLNQPKTKCKDDMAYIRGWNYELILLLVGPIIPMPNRWHLKWLRRFLLIERRLP